MPRASVVPADVEIVSPPGPLLDEAALADAMAAALEAWALPRLRPVIEAVPLLEVDMSGFFGAEPCTMLGLDAFVDARAGRFHRAGANIGALCPLEHSHRTAHQIDQPVGRFKPGQG